MCVLYSIQFTKHELELKYLNVYYAAILQFTHPKMCVLFFVWNAYRKYYLIWKFRPNLYSL